MIKTTSKFLITATVASMLLVGCSQHEEALKVLPNEIGQANECLNTNKEFERDCYDLISYKNSIALLRLGIFDYSKGNYEDALKKYSLSKVRGNFYANTLLADLYFKGRGVPLNQKKGLALLKEVDDVDPIAAYKLSFYYLNKKNYSEAIELLNFAAQNNVKKAQYELSKIYSEGTHTEVDLEKSKSLYKAYEDKSNSFINKIYGI